MTRNLTSLALVLFMPIAARAADNKVPTLPELKKLNAAFAPVPLNVDLAELPGNERQALAKIVAAARVMDGIYLRQVWAGNEGVLMSLLSDPTPLGKERLKAFLINKGPWWRLDGNRPFLANVPPKPPAGTFYPADATKADLDTWIKGLAPADKEKALAFFYVIRRSSDNKLKGVGYNLEYQTELQVAGSYLLEAAALTTNETLANFLRKRAAAFASNDYYESDMAWMQLDAAIEPVLGPYEVYEDEWFNAKAAFEAFVTIRDDAETAKLAKFSAELQGLENTLPIEPAYRNPKIGALAPIRVVNSIFSSGEAYAGVQTAAFNLPNDERIAKEVGTKRVMLKNVQEAKFAKVLLPISKVALAPIDQKNVVFEAFFTHILMHELMHGLGPHDIKKDGKPTTVRAELQDLYSAVEEAKADITGLWAMQQLIDKGLIDKKLEKSMYVTFLASSFRSLRFGINEAHGKGVALQLNYLLDEGAYKVAKNGSFAVDAKKAKDAVAKLTQELLSLQALGDRNKASDLFTRLAVVRPETQKVLDKLVKVPTDIAPSFPTADKLGAEGEK
ncbi:MAG: hypothetical protein HY903_00590 [Deltaproteobacteria bacterium]|nr:hypothetical protein [Deltaproteobacteria bacterium]